MYKSASSSTSSPPPPSHSISHLPWKTRISISVLSHITAFSRRPDGTINRRLLNLIDFQTRPNPKPVRGVFTSDITVDPSRNLWFRLFTPTTSNNTPLPVVIFFHGGGFTYLSASSMAYDAVCRRFARKLPAVVVSVDYRLTPEHRFPRQYDDGFDVLKYLNQNPDILPPNADLTKTLLAGDSAGANLAHHVAVRTCEHEPNLSKLKLVGMVSIQPFFGGEERTESEIRLKGTPLVSTEVTDWLWKVFLPEGENRDHWAVNVSGPNAVDISKFGKFPAVMVVTSGLDALRDRQVSYCEWLKRSGNEAVLVDYPRMIHAFYVFPELSESSQLFTEIKHFVSKRVQMSRN